MNGCTERSSENELTVLSVASMSTSQASQMLNLDSLCPCRPGTWLGSCEGNSQFPEAKYEATG